MGTWEKTPFPGVRFRRHKTRKHGVQFDKYYVLTYKLDGKAVTEAVGWASQGVKPADCYELLSVLKSNHKAGHGPRTLRELREENEYKREEELRRRAASERRNIGFREFFEQSYMPDAELAKRPETARKEREHVKNWIGPVVDGLPMRELGLEHVKRIRANLAREERSPRTQQYVLRTFSTVWNHARDAGMVDGPCPTKHSSFRLPKVDNERERFLSKDEADALLEAVQARSARAHDIALLALNAGLRFSEIANLTWDCVDLDAGRVRIIHAKGDKSRTVPLTQAALDMLNKRGQGQPQALVFPDAQGQPMRQVPSSFKRAIDDVGLNQGVDDPRKRFSFHGLRHTYASRLVQAGVELYRVQRLLGHGTPTMTQRYGHLEARDLEEATRAMERRLEAMDSGGKVLPFPKAGDDAKTAS